MSASLVQRAGPGRYGLHQLVRLHAAGLAAEAEDGREAKRVLVAAVGYFLARAGWADVAVMGERRLRVGGYVAAASGVPDPFVGADRSATALVWLEAERANLLGVLRAAVEAGLDEPAWQLALAMTALYLNHRHPVDWIEATRLGVRAAARHGRHDVEARLRSLLSRAYTDLGDRERARVEIDAATEAAAEVPDRVLVASVWEFRGRYLEGENRTKAVAAYRRAIELNERAEEPRGAALCRYFLGCCLDAGGRAGDALVILQEARAALRELGDERMAQRCAYNIGLAHLHRGEYIQAGRELTAAADAFAAGELWHYEVPAREALAELAERTGDTAAARRELARALWIEEKAGGGRAGRLRASLAGLS